MRQLALQLWRDETGALILLEWLLLVLLLVIGIIVGLTALRAAIVTEAEETANAILALNQSFSFSGLQLCCPPNGDGTLGGCLAFTGGSSASDVCDFIPITSTAAEICVADANPCD
jgi:hypothetical protein